MHYTQNWLKRNRENFVVAAHLLPRALHAPLADFHEFICGASEMGDSRDLPERKRRALGTVDKALATGDLETLPFFAHGFYKRTRDKPVLLENGRELLAGFMQDTVKTRYHNYPDLMDYYRRSAVPVGRILLAIAEEKRANQDAADALCIALQFLTHIQDASDDYVNRDRVYLPLDWFELAGTEPHALADSESTYKIRQILDRALDNCDTWLKKATPLAGSVKQKGLRTELEFLHAMGITLACKLRRKDPLGQEVKLSKLEFTKCLLYTWLGI
jgi:phytoene/squalene synthetase